MNENAWISINISKKFVPKGPISNNPALVQIMAWRRPGDKPLSETMLASLLMHICVTRPQWVKTNVGNMLFEFRAWMNNYIPQTLDVITYPCYDPRKTLQNKPNLCYLKLVLQFLLPRCVVETLYNTPYGSTGLSPRCSGGRFKNAYELLNLRALKMSKLHKNHIFQCMGKIFCVEFQRVPLKFLTKYLTHTLKDVDFINIWKFKSS